MQNDEFLILPGVKNTVGRLAALARTGLILCAVLSVAEILCFSYLYLQSGIFCGILSSFILNLELTALSLLVIWCHDTLLPERGYGFTRLLSYLAFFFAATWFVCGIYSTFTGKTLLLNQGLLPFISCILLFFIHLTNLPNMAAASRSLKIQLSIFPLLMMLIFLCDQPGGILIAAIGKLALLLLLARPLRQLADIAPRIISMPQKEESANE